MNLKESFVQVLCFQLLKCLFQAEKVTLNLNLSPEECTHTSKVYLATGYP